MEGPSIMSKVDEIKSDISRLGDEEFKVLKNHIKQEEKLRRTKKAKETRQRKLLEKEKTKADDDIDDIINNMNIDTDNIDLDNISIVSGDSGGVTLNI